MNENAQSALQEYRAKLKSGEIKKINLTPEQKLEKNPTSLRLAVNAMCYQCMGKTKVVEDIRNCTAKECALYNVRPYQEK